MTRTLATTLTAFALLGLAAPIVTAQSAAPTLQLPRPSQKSTLEQRIGLTDVKIVYSRPGVKGRAIWGGLVPYDQVWRTGANEATAITFSTDVKINGQMLPAGEYSLHTIPTAGDWTIIFNKSADLWGSYDYDQKSDALRVTVTPVSHDMIEWMMFSIPEVTNEKALLALDWEKKRVPLTIEVSTIETALASARKAMASLSPTDSTTAYRAAAFAFDNKVALDEAAMWVDKSIAIKPTWLNHRLKANMLAAAGDKKGAIEHAKKCIEAGKKSEAPPEEMAKMEVLIAEWKKSK
ncbi:MAG: DUF2911 domain-containing protein [Candidatus Eisenbacteria bacterium]|nr:DUF2911 domain-containing protein [Candidatus Eisenbacteria bacterium]